MFAGFLPFITNVAFIGKPSGFIDWFSSYLFANFTGVLASIFEDSLNVYIVVIMRQQIKKLLDINQSLRSPGSTSESETERRASVSAPEKPKNEVQMAKRQQFIDDNKFNLKNLKSIISGAFSVVILY
jgi:hypothetical protein